MSRGWAPASALMGALWETRRRAYASGLLRQRRAPARVVSVGNLTVGGTGKTTLTLHLAEALAARGTSFAVVCRRYRPGPQGHGDEELLFQARIGRERTFAGTSKWREAMRAAAAGAGTVLVDDGFSHWPLARDLEIVVLDVADPFGGGHFLPRGRLREPVRALQRAAIVVVSRVRDESHAQDCLALWGRHAPGALWAAGRHQLDGVTDLSGSPAPGRGAARVVTATGNPAAVRRTAVEAGFAPVTLSAYRDHHWFSAGEMRRELSRAEDGVLLLTEKDAVRWTVPDPRVRMLRVRWQWVLGGQAVMEQVHGGQW